MTYYKITRNELLTFLRSDLRLAALESGGVDNWVWYGDSQKEYINDYNNCNGTEAEDFDDIAKYELSMYEEINE